MRGQGTSHAAMQLLLPRPSHSIVSGTRHPRVRISRFSPVVWFVFAVLITVVVGGPYWLAKTAEEDKEEHDGILNYKQPGSNSRTLPTTPTMRTFFQPSTAATTLRTTPSPTMMIVTASPSLPPTIPQVRKRTSSPLQKVHINYTLPWHHPQQSHVWLERALNTGFGDRFSVYMCGAAVAAMYNKTMTVFWDESNSASRNSDRDFRWFEIAPHITLPPNLEINGGNRFGADGMPKRITHYELSRGGIKPIPITHFHFTPTRHLLPSRSALDGIYTHCWRTYILPFTHAPLNFGRDFTAKFRELGHQFDISLQSIQPDVMRWIQDQPNGYVVFHFRWGDKKDGAEFCTRQALSAVREWPVVLVSDDMEAALTYANGSHPNIKHFGPLGNVTLTALRDLALLLHSRGVIQHCTGGWSAFSAFPAMIRQLPLMQTFLHNQWNPDWDWTLLDVFALHGPDIPEEFLSCRPGPYNIFANESIARFRQRLMMTAIT